MNLEHRIYETRQSNSTTPNRQRLEATTYQSFSEQFLEEPSNSNYKTLASTPTFAIVKGIPVLNDF